MFGGSGLGRKALWWRALFAVFALQAFCGLPLLCFFIFQYKYLSTQDTDNRLPGLAPDDSWRPKATHIECLDLPAHNQTCRFRGVLFDPNHDSQMLLLTVPGTNFVLCWLEVVVNWIFGALLGADWAEEPPFEIGVYLHSIPGSGPMKLRVRKFPSNWLLEKYVLSRSMLRVVKVTTLRVSMPWPSNWAHALFDGLYPGFVGAAKFGLSTTPFHTLWRDAKDTCRQAHGGLGDMQCFIEEAAEQFGGLTGTGDATHFVRSESYQYSGGGALLRARLAGGAWLYFEDMVVGGGLMGEYTSVVALPGSLGTLEHGMPQLNNGEDVLRLFVNRLIAGFGFPALPERSDSARVGTMLRVVFAGNKRFSPGAVDNLNIAVKQLNELTRFNASLAVWSSLLPLWRQIALLRTVDIYFTSTGTALYYTVFLPDGSVVINVGQLLSHGLPAYGEDFLGASNPRIRFWHPQPQEVLQAWRNEFQPSLVLAWVNIAADLIGQGFSVPLTHPEENLSPLGAIQRELVLQSHMSYRRLRGFDLRDHGFHCHASREDAASGLADLIYESLPTIRSCKINVTLLRQLKHDLAHNLGVAPGACECVICTTCQGTLVQT